MHIVEFAQDTLRFIDEIPSRCPPQGFVWIFLERDELAQHWLHIQQAAQMLGGSPLLDLHCQDLENAAHPSDYDYTSVYDLIIFRRLSSLREMRSQALPSTPEAAPPLQTFVRIRSLAVGFAVFDHLLISVHPAGCPSANGFIQRCLVDAQQGLDASGTRSRIPLNPSDLVLRMVNTMVDGYLEIRKDLAAELDGWQTELLDPGASQANWGALMTARNQLHLLEDLCEEQRSAIQEWLDSLREAPLVLAPAPAASHAATRTHSASGGSDDKLQAQRDMLTARARDIIEHIERVLTHVHRLELSAETAVQIHFSVQGKRTNEIMKMLTALTAIFLPLNLIAGIFGMNFQHMPALDWEAAFWVTIGSMACIALLLGIWFWRKRYLELD